MNIERQLMSICKGVVSDISLTKIVMVAYMARALNAVRYAISISYGLYQTIPVAVANCEPNHDKDLRLKKQHALHVYKIDLTGWNL